MDSIYCENLEKSFGNGPNKTDAVRGVSYTFRANTFYSIIEKVVLEKVHCYICSADFFGPIPAKFYMTMLSFMIYRSENRSGCADSRSDLFFRTISYCRN